MMDAFLRRVLEQRLREQDEAFQRTPLSALPVDYVELREEKAEGRKGWLYDILGLFTSYVEVSSETVAQELGFSTDTANVYLCRMVQRGMIERSGRGVYRLPRSERPWRLQREDLDA